MRTSLYGGTMRLGRLILVVVTLVTILLFPLVARDALQSAHLTNAYAAPPGGADPAAIVLQHDDGDDDNDNNNDGSCCDNNDESDNEGEDGNDNVKCWASL